MKDWLIWIVPGAVVLAAAWRFSRPFCQTLVVYLIRWNGEAHASLVTDPIKVELQQIEDHGERIARLDTAIAEAARAANVRMNAFESALVQQNNSFSREIVSVIEPLKDTLKDISGALTQISRETRASLEKIAQDTTDNAVAIGKLQGAWDGSERRAAKDRRRSI